MQKRQISCFIIGSIHDHKVINELKSAIIESGINVFDQFNSTSGEGLLNQVSDLINKSDFCIAILSPNQSDNITFELGIAHGKGKPLLIFAHEDSEVPNYILTNHLYYRYSDSPNSLFSVKLAIKKLANNIVEGKRLQVKRTHKTDKKDQFLNKSYIRKIEELREIGQGRELEYLVQQMFTSLGIEAILSNSKYDRGFDLALWIPEVEESMGNPILVELKMGRINRRRLNEAADQVLGYLEKTNSKTALIIYLNREGEINDFELPDKPHIQFYDLNKLANTLLNTRFEDVLRDKRNKLAHGVN
jgi:hypothetical protein